SESPPTQYERRQAIGLFTGLALFLLLLILPAPAGMDVKAWRTSAATVLIGVWWITEAVHPAVTALVPLVIFPFLRILTPQEVSAAYGDYVIFLFMGGFLFAVTREKWILHSRVPLKFLSRVGSSPPSVSFGLMSTSVFISLGVSNTATTMMMLPIV